VHSLPWLMLTGPDHIVRGEGFGIEELDDRFEETGSGAGRG